MALTLHDIRIHSPFKNVVLIRGSQQDADPVSLSGHVVFSLDTTTCVSSISLSLQGTHNIHFVENFQTSTGKTLATCPFNSVTPVLNCNWENLLSQSLGEISLNQKNIKNNFNKIKKNNNINNNHLFIHSHSTNQLQHNFTNFQTYYFDHNKISFGQTPFPETSQSYNNPSGYFVYELPPGNYSLPFKITIPGSIPETVDFLKSTNITYILKSSINTIDSNDYISTTNNNLIKFKYIRFIRTLSNLQLALNEEYLAENSWSGKLQYKIRIPRKFIPIGSNLLINLLIIPIMKGLKLGKLTFQIAQLIKLHSEKLNDFGENTFIDERIIYHQSLPLIPSNQLSNDIWALRVKLPMSNILKNSSPDINLNNLITVKHKLIIYINLVNPDGHNSQIKSKIPLSFYIKPNTKIYSKSPQINDNGLIDFKSNYKSLLFNNNHLDNNDNNFNDNDNDDINNNYDDFDNNNQINLPELLVCPCDELNPESFLFNDFDFNQDDDYLNQDIDIDYLNDDNDLNLGPQIYNPIQRFSDYPNNINNHKFQTPPTYPESKNDLLYEPNQWSEGNTPLSASSFTSLNKLNNVSEDAPSYKQVYDDDVSDIGEPSPPYPANSLSTFTNIGKTTTLRSSLERRLNALSNTEQSIQSLPNTRSSSPLSINIPSSTSTSLRVPVNHLKRAMSSSFLNHTHRNSQSHSRLAMYLNPNVSSSNSENGSLINV